MNQEKLLDLPGDVKALQSTMKQLEKLTHGGKRTGAGRPKGTTKETKKTYKTFSVSCLEDEMLQIKTKAESLGKSPSRYLVDLALKDINN